MNLRIALLASWCTLGSASAPAFGAVVSSALAAGLAGCLPATTENGTACRSDQDCTFPRRCTAGGCQEERCLPTRYPTAVEGTKQWLMIGDSISIGATAPATKLALALGMQLVHNPGNGNNVWYGAHCLEEWLGQDPSRWEVVSFQFGLHDLKHGKERLEAHGAYSKYLTRFASHLAVLCPKAKLIWTTTTPVPVGIESLDGRTASDVPIYNEAARLAIHSSAAAPRVRLLDLYSRVAWTCGTYYTSCPNGCSAEEELDGGGAVPCYQLHHNVHFAGPAYADIASAYVDAAFDALRSAATQEGSAKAVDFEVVV